MKKLLVCIIMCLMVTSVFVGASAEDNFVYISDLEMKSHIQRNANWDPGLNICSYYKATISVAGVAYEKGVTMHAVGKGEGKEAECVWDISGLGYTTFTAIIGKDDGIKTGKSEASQAALVGTEASFLVYADDELVVSEVIKYPNSLSISADITGASTITLKVGSGGDDDTNDCGAFADAKLIKAASEPGTDTEPDTEPENPDTGDLQSNFVFFVVFLCFALAFYKKVSIKKAV